MYYPAIRQFAHTLRVLDSVLTKAERYAESRKFDVNNFVNARLAPDMLPFVVQIRIACDAAKVAAAALAQKDAPKHEDNEKTFEELHARIGKALAFLDGLHEGDFTQTSPDMLVRASVREDKQMRAEDYLFLRQIPNFYFHVVTAYAILRSGGVDLGKADYLGDLPFAS
jgi:hypothetical protein